MKKDKVNEGTKPLEEEIVIPDECGDSNWEKVGTGARIIIQS